MKDQKIINPKAKKILALSGGVGGAKLVLGLSKILAAENLIIAANTADDFEHIGLSISPDLDTVMYTLGEINNKEQGWGIENESWNALEALKCLGGDTWFRLGDKDLATHLIRSQRLACGETLSQVTATLCQQLGIHQCLLPMTDDSVRTRVLTDQGDLSFQEYFVREQCQPIIRRIYFEGIDNAIPQEQLMQTLKSDQLAAIIICPSNPFVSVDPILNLSGVREAICNHPAPVIAVSPIVAGLAIKGPAAKMMKELNMPSNARAVAKYYEGLINGFVVDSGDDDCLSDFEEKNVSVCITNTIMNTLQDRINLAKNVIDFAEQLK